MDANINKIILILETDEISPNQQWHWHKKKKKKSIEKSTERVQKIYSWNIWILPSYMHTLSWQRAGTGTAMRSCVCACGNLSYSSSFWRMSYPVCEVSEQTAPPLHLQQCKCLKYKTSIITLEKVSFISETIWGLRENGQNNKSNVPDFLMPTNKF